MSLIKTFTAIFSLSLLAMPGPLPQEVSPHQVDPPDVDPQEVCQQATELPSKVEIRIDKVLTEPCDLKIENIAINALVEKLRADFKLPAIIDHQALNEAKIEQSTPVNADVAHTSLRGVLHVALQPQGLRAIVEDDLLLITVDPEAFALAGGKTSHWVSLDDERVSVIRKKLEMVSELDFDRTALNEAVRRIALTHELEIGINTRALEDIGLTIDVPVFCNIRNVKLIEQLRFLLAVNDLTLAIRNNVLVITTEEDAQSEDQMIPRLYLLDGTGLTGMNEAASLFQTTVDPSAWEMLGGPCTMWIGIDEKNDRMQMLISGTLDVHFAVEDVIASLRKSQRLSKGTFGQPSMGTKTLPRMGAFMGDPVPAAPAGAGGGMM